MDGIRSEEQAPYTSTEALLASAGLTAISKSDMVIDTLASYRPQVISLVTYAQSRIVESREQSESAAADLTLIRQLKKAIEEQRTGQVKPLNDQVKQINELFKTLTVPLDEADRITDDLIKKYRAKEKAKLAEALAIEAEKFALSQREAALNGGVITVDLTPIVKPDEQLKHIVTGAGTVGMRMVPKWALEDITKVPAEFLMLNEVLLGKQVRAGRTGIPGIRTWLEEELSTRANR
jgi:hypothetical protein